MTLTLAEAVERSNGMLIIGSADSEWRRVDGGLTLSRNEPGKGNPLLEDAERRRRIAEGEPTLSMSLSAGEIERNPLLADAERRAKQAAEQWQDRYPG